MARKHKKATQRITKSHQWMCSTARGTKYADYFRALFGALSIVGVCDLPVRLYCLGSRRGTALRVHMYPVICNWYDQGVAVDKARRKLQVTVERYIRRTQ